MSAALSAEILRARRRGVTSSEHATKQWGYGAAGSAPHWQCGGQGSSPLSSTIIPGQTTWDFLSRGPGMAEGISIGATQKWPVEAGGVGQRRWTAEVRRSRWIGRFLALKRSAGYGCRFGEPGTFVRFGECGPHAAPGRHDSHPRTVQRLAAWSRCTRFDA